jgi:hypothetical protein
MLSPKRAIQFFKRKSLNLLTRLTLSDQYIKNIENDLEIPNPPFLSTAVFNFTIDFELAWGNGNVANHDHSYERRKLAAMVQSENFDLFLKMFDELNFPTTWATLGKLANPLLRPTNDESFKPQWSKKDWYSEDYLKLDKELWDGRGYLEKIKNQKVKHEIMSHGFAHIDYCDPATIKEIAEWDMTNGISSLRDFGFQIDGFVFPCNHKAHLELLASKGINIVRGDDEKWNLKTLPISTPIGFWLSPAFFTFGEIKSLINKAVDNKSFFHPWMHLIECDLRQRDLEHFYYPLFNYVKELETKGRIQNLSFSQIFKGYKNHV